MGCRWRHRKTGFGNDFRFPYVIHLSVFRYRVADGDLVRKRRPEYFGHASFIHPLSKAADPAWEARSDWDIYKGIAKKFSEIAEGNLGIEKDIVTIPDAARYARRISTGD